MIVACLPESEDGVLPVPQTRARHTLFSLLSKIMLETVKRVLGQSDWELVVECRQCGSNVDPDAESCRVSPPRSLNTILAGDE